MKKKNHQIKQKKHVALDDYIIIFCFLQILLFTNKKLHEHLVVVLCVNVAKNTIRRL